MLTAQEPIDSVQYRLGILPGPRTKTWHLRPYSERLSCLHHEIECITLSLDAAKRAAQTLPHSTTRGGGARAGARPTEVTLWQAIRCRLEAAIMTYSESEGSGDKALDNIHRTNEFRQQEVNALMKALQHAELELADLEREPLRLLNLKAPFNCLPNEVISHILLYIVEDDGADECRNGHCGAEIRLVTSVCQLWRHVAAATPRIWNSLSVENVIEAYPQIDHINNHLDRSGAILINLRIRDANIGDLTQSALDPESLRELIINCTEEFSLGVASVQRHLWRCRNLDIDLQGTVAARHVLPLNGPLPNLQHVNLQLSDQATSYVVSKNMSLMDDGSSCRLRELEITANEMPPMLLQFINSEFITDLRLHVRGDSIPPQHLEDFILGCPVVETMILEYDCSSGYHPTPRDISTPNLGVLHLTGYYMTPHLKLWDAPRLHDLAIQNPVAGLETPTFQFPALESLALTNIIKDRATDEKFLFTILNNHPSLTTLTTVTNYLTTYLFELLLDMCPNLSTLTLLVHCGTTLDSPSIHSVLALLEKRPQVHLYVMRAQYSGEPQDVFLLALQLSHPERVTVEWVYLPAPPAARRMFEFDWE